MGAKLHRVSQVNPSTQTGICTKCGPVSVKPIRRKSGVVNWSCKPSQKQRAKDRYQRNAKKSKRKCARCGFIPVHPCQMDIHHRDGNRSNDTVDNLEVVCSNCHRLEMVSWDKSSTIGIGKRSRSSVRNRILAGPPKLLSDREKKDRKNMYAFHWRKRRKRQLEKLPPGAEIKFEGVKDSQIPF